MLGAKIFGLQLLQRMHQGFRHITSAIRSKMALGIRQIRFGNCAHTSIFMQTREGRKEFVSVKSGPATDDQADVQNIQAMRELNTLGK